MNRKSYGLAALVLFNVPLWAGAPAEWKYSQNLSVSSPGLTQVRLPAETLGQAQPNLTDLLLLGPQGQEVPFFIDQPHPEPARILSLERTVMTMDKKKTVIMGYVPAIMRVNGFDAISLFTPTDDFLKPLTLEASPDGHQWTTLLRQAPIFSATVALADPPGLSGGKQSGNGISIPLRIPKGSWTAIRISLDNSDSPPLRVSGVALSGLGRPVKDLVELEPEILDVASDAHKTEINLRLPASGLPIESLRFDIADTTFRRPVQLSIRTFHAGEFHEDRISSGTLYRITLGSQKSEELVIPVGRPVPGSLVTLTIENGDSPPVTVRHLWARVLPRDMIFDAPSAGTFQLCSGNSQAAVRNYDVAQLRGSISQASLKSAVLQPTQTNPAYRASVPTVVGEEEGSDIDTDPWHFRKKVILTPGTENYLWRLELDPETMAHNGGRMEALRLVHNDKQLPYILDYAGVERTLPLTLEPLAATQKGKSQWAITLPFSGLPITQLRVTIPNTLFQRTITLYENFQDENQYQESPVRHLGSATWTRVRADGPANFDLVLAQSPRTNRLILETDNGDNAPIQPAQIQAYYRAPRLVFRAHGHPDPLYLYYGQPEVGTPQYDLSLIAPEVLSTPPQEAHLGPEESLKATPWWQPPTASGNMKPLFWGVMILVVLGLLLVIAKLLPAVESKEPL